MTDSKKHPTDSTIPTDETTPTATEKRSIDKGCGKCEDDHLSHPLPVPSPEPVPNEKSGTPPDPETASLYSLHMRRDFRYYFQHPYFRLAIAYLVTFLNFLIYAEDPVSHSEAECFIPVVGNCFSFVATKYPPNGWAVIKVLMWLTAMITGLFVGKLIIHDILFSK